MKILVQNKKASHNYILEEFYECGIVLQGTEIKSVRHGRTNVDDAYVSIERGEAFVNNMHISKYEQGNRFNHDERRVRKLLLNKKEIDKLIGKQKQDGYTLICTKVYLTNGFAKLQVALAKGKKSHDKREALKEKDSKMQMAKYLKGKY